jgi:methyl-accepting chemotaxis protein
MLAYFNQLKIRTKLLVLVCFFGAGLLGIGINDYLTLQNVKVGGPLYERALEDQALLADLLPPPLFVAGSNLTIHNMLETDDASTLAMLTERLKSNRAEFDQRAEYWDKTLEDGALKQNLLTASIPAAKEFYELYDTQFLPAFQKGDKAKAGQILAGPMQKAYERHRTAIKSAVVSGNSRLEADDKKAGAAARAGTERLVIGNIVVFAAAFAFGLYLSSRISQGLKRSVELMRDVGEGEGDLTRRLDETGGDELSDLAKSFNRFTDKIHDIMTDLRAVAEEVASASRQLSASAEDISDGAQQTAASLEETAASLEEITSTTKQTADNAQRATELARTSAIVAEKGGKVVDSTVVAMSEIASSSSKIAEISGTIDEIAFQTNLLALNAAVEAARAGDQGRGFAVVAGEVRSLAQRSAGAAREIKTLIGASGQYVEGGKRQANQSGEALGEIVSSVRRVTEVVAEIAAAAREQRLGVEQVNTAVGHVDRVTQSAAARTEEMAATAELLAGQATQVSSLVNRFKLRGDTGGKAAPHAKSSSASDRRTKTAPKKPAQSGTTRVAAKAPEPEYEATGTDDFESF